MILTIKTHCDFDSDINGKVEEFTIKDSNEFYEKMRIVEQNCFNILLKTEIDRNRWKAFTNNWFEGIISKETR